MSHNKKKGGRSLTKLALFEERDKIHPRNETYEGLENFTGLVPKRSKTDLFFLILYILCIITVAILFYFAFSTHDFNRLGRGFDFRGDICGKPDTTVAEKQFLYFEDPVNVGDTGMCVYSCPKTDGIEMCFYDVDGVTLLDDYCYFSYATIAIGKFCLPPEMGNNRTIIEKYTKTTSALFKTVGGDLFMAWDIFLIALVLTLAFGMVFIVGFFCDITRKITLWICVLGSGVLGVGLCAFFVLDYRKMIENECAGGVYESGCIGIKAFLLIALAVIIILSLIGFYIYIIKNRDKIKFVLKKASTDVLLKPIRQVKTMILFLIFQYALQVIVTAFFFFAGVVLLASGKLTLINKKAVSDFPNDKYFEIRQPSYIYFAVAFFIIMFLWTMGNILLFGRMVITSAVSTWYFSREKSILDLPIFRGLKFVTRYHIGSIAYGSVCVALNWPFKSFFGIIKNRLKKIRNRKSRTFKFWMSTCNITLTVYELVLKYVSNKNLMQTAIFGEEFCIAGVRVFYLKYRNESRLKLLKNTIGYSLMLGKVFISLVVTLISYNFLLNSKKSLFGHDLSYLQFAYVPALLILLITMFVSQTFTSLFDLVIDAIFFCFVCDEEMYTGKQRYAEQELREFMDQFGKEAKKQDDDLDVRARPKQFKGEDENSLIEDNIFVTEQHKNPAKESDNKKLAKDQEDDHKDDHSDDADPQAYKVLNVDDAVSVSDNHAISVSDVTTRWQPPKSAKSDHKDEESGFGIINFGNFNQKAGSEEEDDDDEEENDHSNNNGTKISGFTPDGSRIGFGLQSAKQRIGNRANRMKQEEEEKGNDDEDEEEDGDEEEEEEEGEEEEDDGEVKQESQRKPKERADDDEDDEDEEDLEHGDQGGNANNKKKTDQSKLSSRLDSLYKLKNTNSNKKNESKSGDKSKFIF